MRSADAGLVAGLGDHVLEGHPRPQLHETGCELSVAHGPIPTELDELALERAFPGLDEVHEHVHPSLDPGRPPRRRRHPHLG